MLEEKEFADFNELFHNMINFYDSHKDYTYVRSDAIPYVCWYAYLPAELGEGEEYGWKISLVNLSKCDISDEIKRRLNTYRCIKDILSPPVPSDQYLVVTNFR